MAATRKQLLARLHCIKRDNGWDDATYRDVLKNKTAKEGQPGKTSAADLSDRDLARLVASLGAQRPKGAPRPVANEWAFIDTAPTAKQPLLRKICAVCRAMKVGRAYAEGTARHALKLEGAVVSLAMLSEGQLWIVAGALERTRRWGGPGEDTATQGKATP